MAHSGSKAGTIPLARRDVQATISLSRESSMVYSLWPRLNEDLLSASAFLCTNSPRKICSEYYLECSCNFRGDPMALHRARTIQDFLRLLLSLGRFNSISRLGHSQQAKRTLLLPALHLIYTCQPRWPFLVNQGLAKAVSRGSSDSALSSHYDARRFWKDGGRQTSLQLQNSE